MSEQTNKNHNKSDKVMEAYYSFIGECHLNNIAKELETKKEEIEQIEVPDTLNKWFEDFIKKNKRKEMQIIKRKQVKRISSRIAMVFLVLSASLSILTLSVEAIRIKVFNFFTETTKQYTSVRVGEEPPEDDASVITWSGYFYPSYLPEGFKLESAEEFNTTKIIQFSDANGEVIQFVQAPNGTDFQLDTEKGSISEVMIDTEKGILVEKESNKILFWNNNEASFYISSNIDADTMINICESIEKK